MSEAEVTREFSLTDEQIALLDAGVPGCDASAWYVDVWTGEERARSRRASRPLVLYASDRESQPYRIVEREGGLRLTFRDAQAIGDHLIGIPFHQAL